MSDVNELMTNVQAELLLVGSFFKKPDLYVTYSKSIRSKYDFSDKAMRFFYDFFEDYYLTFSQEITENKVNNFATQNMDRLKHYKEYGGWQTIYEIAGMADPNDIKNIYNTVKKYALVREYDRNGFPAEKIMSFKDFDKLSPNDVYRLIRAKADKINTNVSSMDEPEVLTKDAVKLIDGFLIAPQMGVKTCWYGYNEAFKGCLPGNVLFTGGLANEGKSRNLVMLIAYLTLVQQQKVMFLSCEMSKEAIKSALITTVVNNEEFQKLHGVQLKKPEREITLGLYKDDNGNYIERRMNTDGVFTESEESYLSRVRETSEYKKMHQIGQWLESEMDGKFYFNDITSDYSDESLDIEIRRANIVYGCNIVCFDTMKSYSGKTFSNGNDWIELKQTATKFTELCKSLNIFGIATFQMTDSTINEDPLNMSSMCIANSKQIKHVCDFMTLGKRIHPDEYHKYQFLPYCDSDWGEPVPVDLNEKKNYYCMFVDKNRQGRRGYGILFEYDLNLNVWINIGELVRKK